MPTSPQIDPRGPRFAATLTSLVLAAVLLTAPGPLALVAPRRQTAVFAIGAVSGVQHTPYSLLFRTLLRPGSARRPSSRTPRRRGSLRPSASASPSSAWSASRPARRPLGLVATGFALAAALLNAAFGFCLGCEIYLLTRRAVPATSN